jgi:iron complex outermembrane receptor protein
MMNQPNHKLKLKTLSTILLLSGIISFPTLAQKSSDVGTINIAGEGDNLGVGYMIQDDGFKQKSTITKSVIDKAVPSQNISDFLMLAPGVNSLSYDGTGLWGGTINYRGFAMNQMGFTVNGMPVNDAANYAVYPMEYIDSANLCEVYITGSVDNEAPHVAASGGNIGLVSCRPKNERSGKVTVSYGSNNFSNIFARIDSGLLGEDKSAKFFLSYSHGQSDKFYGYGGAIRDHVDAGFDWKISSSTKFESTLSMNKMFNNSLYNPTKAEYLANNAIEYSKSMPSAVYSGASSSNFGFTPTTYYGLQTNPFEDIIFTNKIESQINDKLTLKAEPYFWYGYGAGPGATTLALAASGAADSKGIVPGGAAYPIVNPYTGTTNTSGSSVTIGGISPNTQHTDRAGVTLSGTYDIENHKITGGTWIERAVKTQTQPFIPIDANGNISDSWYKNSSGYVKTTSGYPYEKRNYQTQTSTQSLFVSDVITLNNKFEVVPGLKYMSVQRSFENYGSAGTGLGLDYNISTQYNSFLPSIGMRYKLDSQNQVFANITTGSKAPASNGPLAGLATSSVSGSVVTGTIGTNYGADIEKSTTFELGHRYNGNLFNTSVTAFNTQFTNRIATAYDPTTAITTDFNVGDSTILGIEAQAGTKPVNGWSAYVSGSFINSKINQDFQASSTVRLATTGNQMPDTPQWMAGAAIQYASGPVIATLSAKYTGMRYSTLANDESIDPFTLVNFSAGYKFASNSFFKSPTLRFNVQNIFNTNYLIMSPNASGADIKTNAQGPGASSPTYYVGAPRFFSITASTEF